MILYNPFLALGTGMLSGFIYGIESWRRLKANIVRNSMMGIAISVVHGSVAQFTAQLFPLATPVISAAMVANGCYITWRNNMEDNMTEATRAKWKELCITFDND